MFETAVLAYGPAGKRVWTTCLGMTGEAVLVALAVVVPLMFPAMLPKPQAIGMWIVPPQPPPATLGRGDLRPQPIRPERTQFRAGVLVLPDRIPDRPRILEDPPGESAAVGVVGGIGVPVAGVPRALITDLINSVARPAPPPPAAAPPAPKPSPSPAPPVRIRVSSMEQAVPILRPDPVYPDLAKRLRISGVVRLEGIIGTDGRIK